jgi:hypothetical protein
MIFLSVRHPEYLAVTATATTAMNRCTEHGSGNGRPKEGDGITAAWIELGSSTWRRMNSTTKLLKPNAAKSYATTLTSLANKTPLMMQADVTQNSIQPKSPAQRQHHIRNNLHRLHGHKAPIKLQASNRPSASTLMNFRLTWVGLRRLWLRLSLHRPLSPMMSHPSFESQSSHLPLSISQQQWR